MELMRGKNASSAGRGGPGRDWHLDRCLVHQAKVKTKHVIRTKSAIPR